MQTVGLRSNKQRVLVDTASSGRYVYVGKAEVDSIKGAAVWAVARIDTDEGAELEWASSGSAVNIWDSRVSLTYQ